MGWLRTTAVFIQQAGQLLVPLLGHLSRTVLNLGEHQRWLKAAGDQLPGHLGQRFKETNKHLVHLVGLIYENYPEYPALPVFTQHFLSIQHHAVTHLPTTVTTLTNVFRLF